MRRHRTGTLQQNRLNQQLMKPGFNIDDRTFEELLAYIVAYSRYLKFYNTDNVFVDNWSSVFSSDTVIFMIEIITEPLGDLDADTSLHQKAGSLLRWYSTLENWHQKLVALNENVIANKIGNILSDIIDKKKDRLAGLLDQNSMNREDEASLGLMVNTSKEMILHVQDFVKNYLRTHIFNRHNHQPQNAVYLAFLALYSKAQDQLNTITQRHLDFYYKDVLKQVPDKGIPTKAVVCFELTEGIQHGRLFEDTTLSAGKLFGSTKDVLFTLDKCLLMVPMKITELSTLYLNRNPFIKSGTDQPVISNVSRNVLIEGGKVVGDMTNSPIFGANQDLLIATQIPEENFADIGFIVATPTLLMDEGQREVTLVLNFETESAQSVLWLLIDEMIKNLALPFDIVFNMVFEEAFSISYTTKTGWEQVLRYRVIPDRACNSVSISFELKNTDAPLVAQTGNNAVSSWPALKVILDENAPIYTLSFLKGLELNTAEVKVKVQDVKNLSLYNNAGKLTPGKPFDIFGPIPSADSFMIFGKSELFQKKLTSLSLYIEWGRLPEGPGGFTTYYKEYPQDFSNDIFEIGFYALSDGFWFPASAEETVRMPMFQTLPVTTPEGYKDVVLSPVTEIKITDFEPFDIEENERLKDPLKWDVNAQSGFWKIALLSPPYAFGNTLYQKNYTEIAYYNARHKEPLPLPNRPFVPKVNAVSVNYEASDVIYFNNRMAGMEEAARSNGEFYHITPFRVRKIVSHDQVITRTLLTDYAGEGFLYMTLNGIFVPQSISLFFNLFNHNPFHVSQQKNLVIQYKDAGEWTPLPGKNMLSDETDALTTSGILEISLPPIQITDNLGTYQLRFMVKNEAYTYPKLLGVYPNAVTVTCSAEDPDIIGKEVPAFSINKTVVQIPEIKKILQPASSFGGKAPTPPEQFYTDVSERLRHKDRAVTFWDYEHLTLSYFPDIAIAKCVNLDENFKPRGGQVTLIVLSMKWSCLDHYYLNTGELALIESFIRKKANSQVQLEVRNPDNEWLLVNCIVNFKENDSGGYYVEELNTFIVNYLCPVTSTSESNKKGIGGTIVPGMLAMHISNLPYIESLESLDIEHIVRNGLNDYTLTIYKNIEEIMPTKPWAMLVPRPKHNIYLASTIGKETVEELESQNLQIGIDYIIAPDAEISTSPEKGRQKPKSEKKPKVSIPKEDPDPDSILTIKL